MDWGVYAYPGFEGAQAWIAGLAFLGHRGRERSQFDHTAGQTEPFDAVAVFGLQGRGRQVVEEYQRQGVPVFVIDYGYLRRTNHAHDWRTGHWQVSREALNRPPAQACPPDRFDALGLEIQPTGGDPKGYTLLCVQTPGDASHGKGEQALQAWCQDVARRYPDVRIRPHPLATDLTYGLPVVGGSLAEALSGARLVVTGNSNAGHDALLAGVPVIAEFPGAAWGCFSGSLPSVQQRRAYFNRLAYGQWTWDEFRRGLPQRFILEGVTQ